MPGRVWSWKRLKSRWARQHCLECCHAAKFHLAQVEIARTSLTYLSFEDLKGGACTTDEDVQTRLRENALLDYAARYWGYHARGAPEMELREPIMSFLRQTGKLECSTQIMHIPEYECSRYSQTFPKNVDGFHMAAAFGLHQVLRLLVSEGTDVGAKDSHGCTALHLAAKDSHDKVVQLLLEHRADARERATRA
jgi:hypothetical protein